MERLLVIGPGEEAYRRYALEQMSRSYELVLIAGAPERWERAFVADAVVADVTDAAAVVAAALDIQSRQRVGGVLTWDEAALGPAAAVAAKLGLPSPPATVLACRDKWRQREAFASTAVPSARAGFADTVEEAERCAAEVGYPVVVKPRRLAGSIAVRRADSPIELRRAATDALAAADFRLGTSGGVVVEEFLDGPEISVDSWVADGAAEPVVLAYKTTGFPPHFEETGHLVPDEVDSRLWAAVRDVVVQAHAALKLTRLVTHTELRLTVDGPKVVEVNGRLGGGLIPYLGYLASGQSLAVAAADVAMGREPNLERRWRRAAAIAFCYPPHDMVLGRVEFDAELERDSHVERALQLAPAGSDLLLPPRGFMARAAMLLVTAETAAECRERLAAASGMVSLHAIAPEQ